MNDERIEAAFGYYCLLCFQHAWHRKEKKVKAMRGVSRERRTLVRVFHGAIRRVGGEEV